MRGILTGAAAGVVTGVAAHAVTDVAAGVDRDGRPTGNFPVFAENP